MNATKAIAISVLVSMLLGVGGALVVTVGASATDLSNGDFEDGPVDWFQSSSNENDLIISNFFAPHSGFWVALMGDDWGTGTYDETASIQQQVQVPPDRPVLDYWYWIVSEDVCGFDSASILIDNTEVQDYDLCMATETPGWTNAGVDLTSYAGQTVTLTLGVETDSSLASGIVFDDLSFESSMPVVQEPAAFLPIVAKRWPPIPYTPSLNAIDNSSGDDWYTVSWSDTDLADTYELQEDNNSAFSSPSTVYSGSLINHDVWDQPVGTWYYRVRGCNSYGCGNFSNVRSATVRPPQTDVWIGNSTGGELCLEVYDSGIGKRCWSSSGDHFYGSFPVGTYRYKVKGWCGTDEDTEYFSEGYEYIGDYECVPARSSSSERNFLDRVQADH
jgi:hypothetical protein